MRTTQAIGVCLCVRTMCGALAGQCSVQCRREQRRPRPAQTQYPGNPYVFRSPGPYLMSLSKKKVALSRVFLSHCLPLALLFPSFSHASPSSSPPSPGATLRMNGFQVFTQQLCLSLYIPPGFIWNRKRACKPIRDLQVTSEGKPGDDVRECKFCILTGWDLKITHSLILLRFRCVSQN